MEWWQPGLHRLSAGDGWTPGTYVRQENSSSSSSSSTSFFISRTLPYFPRVFQPSARYHTTDIFLLAGRSPPLVPLDVPGGIGILPPDGKATLHVSKGDESFHCLNCEITRRAFVACGLDDDGRATRDPAICGTFLFLSIGPIARRP